MFGPKFRFPNGSYVRFIDSEENRRCQKESPGDFPYIGTIGVVENSMFTQRGTVFYYINWGQNSGIDTWPYLDNLAHGYVMKQQIEIIEL